MDISISKSKYAVSELVDHIKLKWLDNYSQILRITLISLLVSIISEFIVREALISGSIIPETEGLFTSGKIHPQVLINLSMTAVACMFGSVVYFFESRLERYFFFIAFGVLNSILAQTFINVFQLVSFDQFIRRLAFDFFYCASFKYVSFEFIRKPMANKFSSFKKMFVIRETQDLVMTIVKVKLLIIFGLLSY